MTDEELAEIENNCSYLDTATVHALIAEIRRLQNALQNERTLEQHRIIILIANTEYCEEQEGGTTATLEKIIKAIRARGTEQGKEL